MSCKKVLCFAFVTSNGEFYFDEEEASEREGELNLLYEEQHLQELEELKAIYEKKMDSIVKKWEIQK